MIDFINDVLRAFGGGGGSCGSTTRDNDPSTHRKSKRVKSPKNKRTTTTKPSPSRRAVRFAESRDENNNNYKRSTSLLDNMSASGESEDRDSAMGSREMLLQNDNPLAIMERRNMQNNADNSSEDITEGCSFETMSNLQQRLKSVDSVRKRGIEEVGKFLPSLSFERHDMTTTAKVGEIEQRLKI